MIALESTSMLVPICRLMLDLTSSGVINFICNIKCKPYYPNLFPVCDVGSSTFIHIYFLITVEGFLLQTYS